MILNSEFGEWYRVAIENGYDVYIVHSKIQCKMYD